MKLLRIINKQGYFIRDDFTFDEETEIGLDVEASQGLYKPKWDGSQWVEGATPEEIALIQTQPTIEEPSTLEQRAEIIEHNQDEIATILADVVGVTL